MSLIKKAVEEALKKNGLNNNLKNLQNNPNLRVDHRSKFAMRRKSKIGKVVEKRDYCLDHQHK